MIDETKKAAFLPSIIIDEEPELETDVYFTDLEDSDIVTKITKRFAKGYKARTIIAMACSSFGVLSLMLPLAVKVCGVAAGSIILFFVYFCNLFTLFLLLKVILRTNNLSYRQLVYIYLGKKAAIAFGIFKIIYDFLKVSLYQMFQYEIVYNLIITHGSQGIDIPFYYNIIIIGAPISLYLTLTLLRSVIKLGVVSVISTIVTFFFFIIVVINLPFLDFKNESKNVILFGTDYKHFVYTYSIFSALFGSHFSLFDNLSQFILRTTKRSTTVLFWSQTLKCISLLAFMVLGVFVNPNAANFDFTMIFLNGTSAQFVVVKGLILFLLVLLIPLQVNNGIRSFEEFNEEPKIKNKRLPVLLELLLGLILLMMGGVFIYFAKNPIIIVSFLGGISSSVLFYVFPVLLYSKVFEERRCKYYTGYFLMIIHSLLGATLIALVIMDMPFIPRIVKN